MSASMGDCLNETINGFNKQMESIAKLQEKHPEQEFLVSLTTFNSESKIQFEFLKPNTDIGLTKRSRWWLMCAASNLLTIYNFSLKLNNLYLVY
jgi:hypothetical protein